MSIPNHFPVYDIELYETNRVLAELSLPIIAHGLPSSIFNMHQAVKSGYMSKPYHKLVKSVSCYAEMGVLEDALKAGIAKGLISSSEECTVPEFAKWARWLNTKEGQNIIHEAQLTKRLKKSVAQGETLEQVAVFRAFCMMRQDHGISVKQANKQKDEELTKLRNRGEHCEAFQKEERKWEAEIMKINADYGPVFAYHPPGKEEVAAASYELYVKETRAKGNVAVDRNHFVPGIVAVDMYQRRIYEAVIVASDMYERRIYEADEKRHATNKIYQKEIEAYLVRKMNEFQDRFDRRGEKKVCHLLGIILGKEAVDKETTATKKAGKKRTRTE